MHYSLRALAALLLGFCELFFVAPSVHAAPSAVERVASVEGITEYHLANGLRFLLFPDASKATVTVNVTYLVGSRYESYGETGMAHLLEHLMFKGTPRYGNIFQALAARGMNFNGTTWFDRTNYYETFSASDENLHWALAMEADRMVHSFIAKRDLDSEMTVVRNEMEEGENNPVRILGEKMQAAAFQWHNYGHSTIGARSDVENVDIAHLQAFYRKYYQPDNAVLVVAGNFEPQRVQGWIASAFGQIVKLPRALPPTYTLDPVQDGERQVILRRVGNIQSVQALYHSVPAAHPDYAAFEALAIIFGDTPSGRLHHALVETQQAAGVFANSEALREPGFVTFGAQVREGDSIQSTQDALLATIEGVRERPVTEPELKRARVKLLKDVDLALNDPQQLGVSLSEDIASGDWRLFFLFRDRVRALTVADVQRVAQDYLKPSNRTLGLFIPVAKPDRAPAPAQVAVTNMVKNYRGDKAVQAGEAFVATPQNIEARTQRGALANGMKYAFVPKKTRGRMVSVALRLNLGDEQSLAGRSPAGLLAASMLLRGTTHYTRQEIEDAFDGMKATVAVSGDETAVNVSLEAVREHLPEALALLTEVLRGPTFPEAEFEELRRARLAALESNRSDPQSLATTALHRHGNAYPPGHVRYVETLDEQIAKLKTAKLESVKTFYAEFYGASDGELAIVGDVDVAQTRPLLEQSFGNWTARHRYTRVPDPYHDIAAKDFRIEVPDKSNAIFLSRLPLALSDHDADYPALLLANYLLGGSSDSRLVNRVRQRDGVSYGVGSYLSPNAYEPNSSLGLYAIYAPQNRGRLETALKEELQRLVHEGATPAEVEKAKHAIAQERRLAFTQDASLAATLVRDLHLGRTMVFTGNVDRALAKASVADVNTVLRKYVKPDAFTQVYAGDFGKSQ